MKIVPPYNNGVDLIIYETDLPHAMTPRAWLMRQQPWTKAATVEEAAARRLDKPEYFVRGNQLYGMKGMPVKSSAPLLDQVGFDQHRPGGPA